MCEFASWVEKGGKVYFLTANQIFRTKRGRELQVYSGASEDLTGHGAIRHYYHLEDGINEECIDFSTPANFPEKIVTAIKLGKMRGLATKPQLLTRPARAEYEKVKQPARAECEKVTQAAWPEYDKVTQAAWPEYDKVKQAARAEYDKVTQAAFWDLFAVPANRNPAWR